MCGKSLNPKKSSSLGHCNAKRQSQCTSRIKALSNGFGTVIGNKSIGTQNFVIDKVVFLQSTQCIPLIRFPSSLVPNQSKGEIPGVLPPWVEKMQKVVDDFFNNDSYPTSLNIEAISQQQPEKCCCH
jgi:hypothetical protein